MKELTDKELIEICVAGNLAAFDILIARYRKYVGSCAAQYVLLPIDCDDILQEAFLTALKQLKTLKKPECFKSWLYIITKNIAMTWFRKNQNVISLDDIWDNAFEKGDYDVELLKPKMRLAMKTLSKEQHDVIRHYYYNGENCIRTAYLLGLEPHLVKSRLHNARKKIKKGLLNMNDNKLKSAVFEITKRDLQAISDCLVIAGKDWENRPPISGFLLEKGGKIVATNGLAILSMQLDGLKNLEDNITVGFVKSEDIPKSEYAEMLLGIKELIIQGNSFETVSMAILDEENKFPSYEHIFPKSFDFSFSAKFQDYMKLIAPLDKFVLELGKGAKKDNVVSLVSISFEPDEQKMTIIAFDNNIFECELPFFIKNRIAKEECDCFFGVSIIGKLEYNKVIDVKEMRINVPLPLLKHLLKSLAVNKSDTIEFQFQNDAGKHLIKIINKSIEERVAVFMPIREN
jgi:RNA polymerase sigma-70 factor (ECF subfamily)